MAVLSSGAKLKQIIDEAIEELFPEPAEESAPLWEGWSSGARATGCRRSTLRVPRSSDVGRATCDDFDADGASCFAGRAAPGT
jgi:hypothetical protein